jgi:hypothetical protein
MQETLSPDRLIINIPSAPEEVWIKTDLFITEKQTKLKLYSKHPELRLCMFKTKGLFRRSITIEVFYNPYKENNCQLQLEVRSSMGMPLTGKKMTQNHKYLMILFHFFKKYFPEASDYKYK